MTVGPRRHGAGGTVDDRCRVCGDVRRHTILAADPAGAPLRVLCDSCGSQHNYRGGEPAEPPRRVEGRSFSFREPYRSEPTVSEEKHDPGLEALLRRVIREEAGLTPAAPAAKWRGGSLVLRPGREGVQDKVWPIEAFFHKIVMVRNRLRVLEQQVNSSDLPEDEKLKLQGYVTACYGSLTSFNVLFAEEDDRFRGAGGD
jgi:hypothetical protein